MSSNDVASVLREARELPHGRTRARLTQAAVRLADHQQDVELGFIARLELVRSSYFVGDVREAMTAFVWLLGQWDAEPERFARHSWDLHWRLKWTISHLVDFPTISRTEIEERFEDMRERYIRAGYGERAVAQQWVWTAMDLNDLDAVRTGYETWKKASRDAMADCRACELNFEAKVLVRLDRIEDAHKLAKPLLEESERCDVVPAATFPAFLMWMRDRDAKKAEAYHRRGVALIQDNISNYLEEWVDHLLYLAAEKRWDAAEQLFRRHAATTLDPTVGSPIERMRSLGAVVRFLESLPSDVTLTAPGADFAGDEAVVDVEVLAAELRADVLRLAAEFDARNGNGVYYERFGPT